MSVGLIVILTIIFLVAMFFTFYAFRQEDQKIKKYEREGDTVQDELKRSLEYEENSVKKYIPIQIWIYAISIIVTLIIVIYFIV